MTLSQWSGPSGGPISHPKGPEAGGKLLQAEQLEFVPCGQILEDDVEEELSPAQIRDHIFLILEVKETCLEKLLNGKT